MPGNHASRIAGDDAATSVSVSGRPLKSTTTNGLPGRLDRVDDLLLLAGQVERRARLRLAAHARGISPSASTTSSAECRRGGDGRRGRPSRTRRPGVLSGGSLSLDRACLRERRVRILRLDPVEERDRVRVAADAPPRAEHVVLVVAERADHGDLRRRRVNGSVVRVVLQQHHRLRRRRPLRRAVGGRHEARRVGGLRLVDVRVVEEPGAELDAQDPLRPRRRSAPSRSGGRRAAARRCRGCSCSPSRSRCRRSAPPPPRRRRCRRPRAGSARRRRCSRSR